MKYLNLIRFLFSFMALLIISCHKEKDGIDNALSEPIPTSYISIDSISEIASDIPKDLYNDLTFVNDSTGYAISANGEIIKTTNAGKNWTQLNSPTTLPLQQVLFLNEKKGFIIGGDNHSGILLNTYDAGLTWNIQTLNTSERPCAIYFLNDSTGFITGFNLLTKTLDGGKNWQSIKDSNPRYYGDVKFKNTIEGIVVISSGAYLKTTDGGNSWDSIKSISNEPFYQVSYTAYKTFLISNSKLITLNSENNENIVEVPLMRKVLFLNEFQAIGIGQHYYQLGFFPYGDIYITNDTWRNYIQNISSPSDAYIFSAIAKMSPKKIMILGDGTRAAKVIIINI